MNEKNELDTICDRLEKLKHSSTMPYAFTEQGVSMVILSRGKTAQKFQHRLFQSFPFQINNFC